MIAIPLDMQPRKIKEKSYDEVLECSNGYYNVRKNRRWGYTDERGNEITSLKYDSPSDYEDGLALVCYDRGYMWLDLFGIEHEP